MVNFLNELDDLNEAIGDEKSWCQLRCEVRVMSRLVRDLSGISEAAENIARMIIPTRQPWACPALLSKRKEDVGGEDEVADAEGEKEMEPVTISIYLTRGLTKVYVFPSSESERKKETWSRRWEGGVGRSS